MRQKETEEEGDDFWEGRPRRRKGEGGEGKERREKGVGGHGVRSVCGNISSSLCSSICPCCEEETVPAVEVALLRR